MTEAARAREAAYHFEAKKTGFGQAQDGWSLTLRIQDNDVPAFVRDAKKGTRFVCALVEVADDEQPVNRNEGGASVSGRNIPTKVDTPPQPSPVSTASEGAGVEKRKSPAQIAGYLCTLPSFHTFLRAKFPQIWKDAFAFTYRGELSDEDAAAWCVRDICTVSSRSDITEDNAEWSALRLAFMLWEKEAEVLPA